MKARADRQYKLFTMHSFYCLHFTRKGPFNGPQSPSDSFGNTLMNDVLLIQVLALAARGQYALNI